MPDRDPALQAALNKWMDERPTPDDRGKFHSRVFVAEQAFMAGYHAAFRSLGAVTPEARAALRELVQAAMQEMEARYAAATGTRHPKAPPIPTWDYEDICRDELLRRARAFARLATPPEEGR